jgi:hypothetical protein
MGEAEMTQKDRLIALLSDGQFHDNAELNQICFAYSQRINEMVRAGEIVVETKHDEHNSSHWWWRLMSQNVTSRREIQTSQNVTSKRDKVSRKVSQYAQTELFA